MVLQHPIWEKVQTLPCRARAVGQIPGTLDAETRGRGDNGTRRHGDRIPRVPVYQR